MTELVLTLSGKLNCGKCDDVLLWLHNPALLAVNAGVTDPDLQVQLILAEIVDVTMINSANYQYTVEYDETLLADPSTPLVECDIKELCCAGCLVRYVDEKINEEILLELTLTDNGDGTVTLEGPGIVYSTIDMCPVIQNCFSQESACSLGYFLGT